MTLLEFQKRMAHAIMQPLTSAGRLAPGTDARYIKPNHHLSPGERLEIYSRSYWFRVLDSLYDDFPGLRAVLGRRAFHRLATAYLADCPSRSFTLRNLGSRLADWLQRHPEYAGKRHALALDMVRLEWAHIEAFDGAAGKLLGPEDLLDLDSSFRASLQPYIRLLVLQYAVDDLRIQVNRESDERPSARRTASKQKQSVLTSRLARLKPEPIWLAVHRLKYTVYYRRIAAEEYLLLLALGEGLPIGRAIPRAFENSPASAGQQQALLETWFSTWAQLGWLCPSK
jgi:hypothetical protein